VQSAACHTTTDLSPTGPLFACWPQISQRHSFRRLSWT